MSYPGHAANNPHAAVPWSSISLNQDMFLESRYLPVGVKLIEISKMKTQELHACVRHWSERTDNGEVAFRFKTVKDSDLRGSPSKKRKPPSSSDSEHGDDDEHHRKAIDSQASPSKQKQPSPPITEHGDDDDDDEREATPMGSDHADVDPGKGKIKASPVLWYGCLL